MTGRTGLLLLLTTLPLVVEATVSPGAEHCAQLAGNFGSDPRAMTISDLDILRSCINEQQQAMRDAAQARQEAQASAPQTFRPYLSDDFLP